MKHLKNNKGLSLVELIVSFAILAIAGLAVMGLIQAGTNHFNSTGKDVGLQYEQQVVVNRLRDALLEASDAISYDDTTKTLLVYSKKDMGITNSGAVSHEFQFEMTKIFLSGNELRYASGLFSDLDPSNLTGLADSLLGEDVSDIEFFLDEIDKGKIKFEISFENDGKMISSNQVVALRNAVDHVTDSGEIILFSSESLVDNNILAVTILRDGVGLQPNGFTDIGLDGSDVISVPFTYKVTAVETSRDYAAVWSLHAVGSEDAGVSGIDVNPATGVVTVDPAQASDGVSAVLVCTSVDNPNRKQTVTLNVVNGGIYPTRLAVYTGTPTDYVGYRDYIVYPAISYTDNTVRTEGDLCTWKISVTPDELGSTRLPVGCSFKLDEISHRYTLRVTSQLNDRHEGGDVNNPCYVTLTAQVKAPKKDGTRITPVQIRIPISDITDPNHPCDLLLSRIEDNALKRGEPTVVTASWNTGSGAINDTTGSGNRVSVPTEYSLHWKIEKIGDDTWGRNDRSDFDSTVKLVADILTSPTTSALTKEDDGWYRTNLGVNTIKVDTETWLEWNREFQIKVLCYATDNKGRRYGLGNDVEGTYTGPVEEVLKYKPVKVLLTPVAYMPGESQTASNKLITSNKLKRAVKMSGGTYIPDEIKRNNRVVEGLRGRTLRMYEVYATGIKYSDADRSAIKISKQAAQAANETTRNTTFSFYNTNGYSVPKNGIPRGIQYFFAQYPEDGSDGYVGFSADMNTDLLIDYYKRFDEDATVSRSKKPRYVTVQFRAYDDKGNVSDTYIFNGSFNGSDEYDPDEMTNTRDYKYEIVYDYNNLGIRNNVEIRSAEY